jgi:hypothetical protein
MARKKSISLRCRCGQVQGEVGTARTYTRATCYCTDCRAYAQWLGVPGLLDEAGGVDVVAMAPTDLRFTAGQERIACMSWSERGIYRWYASCCRTPLGNTPRDPRMHYVGVSTACLEGAGAAVDAAFGVPRRCLASTGAATAPVRKRPFTTAWGILRVVIGLAGAKLRGRRESPFFDASTGKPIRTPEIVTGRTN